jgi:queuine/archaeosine tRNA-ribosyltransferase
MLDQIQPFTDFAWVLANKVLEDEKYAKHYNEFEGLKFVDNSVTELGEPMEIDDLKKAYETVRGTYIVSPDWIGEYEKTIEAYKEFIKIFPRDLVVGVLQGATPEEALNCLRIYEGPIVCVPYRVGGSVKGDPSNIMALRRELVVAHIPTDRLVHLLGFTTLEEFAWYQNRPNVQSIDTDVPVRAGLLNQDFDDFDRKTDTSKVALTRDNWSGVCRNIALLRKYMPS